MIASGEEILKYIPQRTPIVMVSALYRADEVSADTGLLITSENIFVDKNHFTEPGIVEHIAQSAALHAGYGFISIGKPVPIGYIAMVKDLAILALPKVNEELKTHVKVINNIMNVMLVKAEVKANEQIIASCEMRVFIKE